MNENTAAATAIEIGPLGPGNQQITFSLGLDPSALKLKIENDKAMRKVLKEYVQSELVEDYHYSNKIGTQELAKPMLLDEGARNIVSLFGLFFGEPVLREEWLDDDHYRVRAHIGVFNHRGEQLTSGDALCSTRESKYAYRKAERVCPIETCGQPTVKKDNKKPGGGWYCWAKIGGCGAQFEANDERITGQQLGRIDNPDLADTENTVLKMSIKRAKTAAARDLPVVSEIFAPEESDNAGRDASVPSSSPPQAKGNGRSKGEPSGAQHPSPAPPTSETAVARATVLWQRLLEKKVELEDLVTQFLPEGVATIEAVDEEYAASILEPLSNLLNAKLKQSN